MNNDQIADSSRWYFGVGIAVILAGIGLFVYFLLNGLFHITDNLTQIVVPGEADLTLQSNLKYTVFLEEQSVVDGKIFSVHKNLEGLTCHLREQSTGANLAFHSPQSSQTYNMNGRSGRSVLEFQSQAAGVYHLVCAYEDGKEGPQTALAVGSGFSQNLISMLARCFASIFGGAILGASFILVGDRIRQRTKQQRRSMSQPFN